MLSELQVTFYMNSETVGVVHKQKHSIYLKR